jgi:hypothetical protein
MILELGPVEVGLKSVYENAYCSPKCVFDEDGDVKVILAPKGSYSFGGIISSLKFVSFSFRPARPGSPLRKIEAGFIIYENLMTLVSFLCKFDLQGNFPLSEAIRKLKRENKRNLALAVQNLLKDNKEQILMIEEDSFYPKIPALSNEGFDKVFTYVSGDVVKTSMKNSDYAIMTNKIQHFFVDSELSLSRKNKTVIRKWLDVSESGGFYWDGERLGNFLLPEKQEARQWERVKESVPHLFLEQLEKRGKVEEHRSRLFLPPGNCEPVCLIRIPSYPRVKDDLVNPKYNEKILTMDAPRGARDILLLRDPRDSCIRIHKNLKVIDKKDEVLYILSRTKKDVYVPGDMGVMTNNIFEDREYHLAGLKVKV